MTLLLRDTPGEAEKTDAAVPVQAPPEVRTCPTCQAPLEEGQDWCLNCGEAQPSRRIALPGKRAAATVLALTTVLVGGAVAASYAALSDGSDPATTTPTQLAQVPAPSSAAPAPDPSAAAPSTAVPATPSTAVPSDTGVIPPDTGSAPVTPAPSSSSSSTSSSSQGTSTSSETATDTDTSTGTSTSKSDDSTADTRTSTTPAETEPVAIKLGEDAAALYDPYKRDTAAGDPKKAFDGDPNTSFPVTVAAGSTQIGAGLTVDLPKLQGIREIDLTTKTPGFKIEIYATDETDLPPDVLDTRWAHLKDVTGVGADADGGKEIVSLGSGTTKYRHVLLWFTAPPTDGSTVRVSELKLLG
jgi:hypothetical protein